MKQLLSVSFPRVDVATFTKSGMPEMPNDKRLTAARACLKA